ncbi:hypothetical protein [Nitrobacter sp. Nb-311A]|uniref:hypothetical protein n=1 Tax=Nitrobacter sp. Nb-311A TaxID=314253 RepID=UPI00103A2B5F|nr:hypothetical protein [Nitrobacter sp. Nb-311A]
MIYDAIADVERIFRALATCHGQQYRALERRIERLLDGETKLSDPATHYIGAGRIVFEPSPEIKSIICDARDMGVI